MTSTATLSIIGRFTFNQKGLDITYKAGSTVTRVTLCPKATCELFTEAGIIEGFDIDANGEPVILFTDNTFPAGYGFDQWNSFVCCFPLSLRKVTALMDFYNERKKSEQFQATIIHLLQPLTAA